jgi:hypothetical protein
VRRAREVLFIPPFANIFPLGEIFSSKPYIKSKEFPTFLLVDAILFTPRAFITAFFHNSDMLMREACGYTIVFSFLIFVRIVFLVNKIQITTWKDILIISGVIKKLIGE